MDLIIISKYGTNIDFINECYPDGMLKEGITAKDAQTLKSIFKDVAYFQFLEKANIELEEKIEENY